MITEMFKKKIKVVEFNIPDLTKSKSDFSIESLFERINPYTRLHLSFSQNSNRGLLAKLCNGAYHSSDFNHGKLSLNWDLWLGYTEFPAEDIIRKLNFYLKYLKDEYGIYDKKFSFKRKTFKYKNYKRHIIGIETSYTHQFRNLGEPIYSSIKYEGRWYD